MHPVIRKLGLFAAFSPAEERALQLAFSHTLEVPAKSAVVREDDPPSYMYFLLEGFCTRQKSLPNGRRQILSFMLPGDACDIGITLLDRRDHTVVAATTSYFARISGSALEHISEQYPKVRAALQWASLVEESIAREWIINLGQRSSEARTAHLICETYFRMEALGLNQGPSYTLPLAQADLADALGISSVHVNRTLQDLRRKGLISFSDRRMTILDPGGLAEVSDFDRTYLHLTSRYAAPQANFPAR
jgi:CRP-like cAMP-binding protein